MKLIVKENKAQASHVAAELIKEELNSGGKVFGLATGSSPEAVYELLADSEVDFSDAISVNLDEYVGLSADHEQSYHYFMHQHLFQYKPFQASYVPDGLADENEEIDRYESILKDHPIDLQLLGIGENGHIAFNEPGTPLDSDTHKVDLTESTIQANKRFFNHEDEVPRQAYTMGLRSIMKAKKIILLAFGERKAQAVKELLEATKADPDSPATVLVDHPDCTVIIDEAAASLLAE